MSDQTPLSVTASTSLLGKQYPIVLIVFLVVITAAGAVVGVGITDDDPSPPPETAPPPSTDGGQRCQIEARTEVSTLVDKTTRVAGGDAWRHTAQLRPGDQVRVQVQSVAGVRPALELRNPDGEILVETDSAPKIEERAEATAGGPHTVLLRNGMESHSGLWSITVERVRTVREEICR